MLQVIQKMPLELSKKKMLETARASPCSPLSLGNRKAWRVVLFEMHVSSPPAFLGVMKPFARSFSPAR